MAEERIPITFKRLAELGLNKHKFPSCSEPVKGQNVGCRQWHSCKIKERHENPDPRFVGVQFIKMLPTSGKPTPKVVNQVATCVHVWPVAANVRLNGGATRIIAKEGEMIRVRCTERKLEEVPDGPGGTIVKKMMEYAVTKEVKVPKYEDPDSEELLAASIAADELDMGLEAEEDEHVEELIRGAAADSISAGTRKASKRG